MMLFSLLFLIHLLSSTRPLHPLLFNYISLQKLSSTLLSLFLFLFYFPTLILLFLYATIYLERQFHFLFINKDVFVLFVNLFNSLECCNVFEPNHCSLNELLPWVSQTYCKATVRLATISAGKAVLYQAGWMNQLMFISLFQMSQLQRWKELWPEQVHQTLQSSTAMPLHRQTNKRIDHMFRLVLLDEKLTIGNVNGAAYI